MALSSVFFLFLMWQCGSALWQGHTLADAAVQRFHQQLNQGEFEQIAHDADEALLQAGKTEELQKILEIVHRKLGDETATTFTNIRVNANTSGTFITTDYQTTFSNGSAIETFTWIKRDGALKLYGYHVDSKELIFN